MPKLYIANVTTQFQIVNYRLDYMSDGARDPRVVIPPRSTPPIPAGRQIQLGGDMDLSQIDSVLDQLRPYGLMAQKDINRLPAGQKVTYVSNVDREVSADAIRAAHAHNTGVKIASGAIRRKQSAVAASDIVRNVVNEKSDVPAPLTAFDISIEQEDQSEFGERRIEEGHTVDLGAARAESPTSGRGRQPARRGGRPSA